MNGASYRLNPENGAQLHGRYTAEDAPGLHIMRINDCSDDNNCFNNSGGSRVNRMTEYWLVKTPDGATFRLGHNANADALRVQRNSMGPQRVR